ncbi:MAG: NFACT family protein [Oscillospiraceae bacterium]|nr:NFACT family protein [Oscillospiraceae bacterium]
MPLDAMCLAAVANELRSELIGARVEKIQQPERDMLVISLKTENGARRLLASAGSGDARVHFTGRKFDNPDSPPMFCMLLRKHLTGARVTDVAQPSSERALIISMQAPDMLGFATEKKLILEFIGRISNIILTDEDRIIDCLRRIGGDMDDKRQVLPGLLYRPPEAQRGKLDPMKVSQDEWQRIFEASYDAAADEWILSRFAAFSPLVCRELAWRAYGETDLRTKSMTDNGAALRREFFNLLASVSAGACEPWSLSDGEGTPKDYSFTRIMQYGNALQAARSVSFSEMLDDYYAHAAQHSRMIQRSSALRKTVRAAVEKAARRVAAQRADLASAANRDYLRECGDIITANLHRMVKGSEILVAQDFYGEAGAERVIPLDARKTPQQNAAKYYKDYTKAKNAVVSLAGQIKSGEGELEYLESVLGEIELAEDDNDLSQIRAELDQAGYLKLKAVEKARRRGAKDIAKPLEFISSTGMTILAGKNNTQNEALTFKTAARSDTWLHAQKSHGAHVVILCGGAAPDEASLMEAASIAAYYSAAREGGKTPVDFTQVKNVKRQPSGRPGMVFYTNYSTIIAIPDGELALKITKKVM